MAEAAGRSVGMQRGMTEGRGQVLLVATKGGLHVFTSDVKRSTSYDPGPTLTVGEVYHAA